MKTDRIGRAGALALTVVGLLAVSWVLPPAVHQARRLCPVRPDGVSEASAYANFARRYGVSCSVCHVSFPQLNDVGYKFRVAGYRMPDEIGADAKWSNWGDNASLRFSENYNVASTKGNKSSTPETNGFANSGLETYPLEGAFGKYVAANDEVDFAAGKTNTTKGTAGSVSMSTLNLLATLPLTTDSFVTFRTGLMSGFQGYGASDRGVGNVSPTFKPTPNQVQPGPGKVTSFTYPGFAASGEGLEIAYNWKGTHVSAQVVNGYNSFNNSPNQGEDNHLKDYGFFVNQMLPFNESAVAAYFYKGSAGYGQSTLISNNGVAGAESASSPFNSAWMDNYYRGILYATIKALPADKLDLLLGVCDGTDQTFDLRTNDPSHRFHSMGWFATLQTVQQVMAHQLTAALSYGTDRASTDTAGNRVSDVTLSFAVPIENNKFGIDFQTQRTQAVGTQDTTADIAQASWTFMF